MSFLYVIKYHSIVFLHFMTLKSDEIIKNLVNMNLNKIISYVRTLSCSYYSTECYDLEYHFFGYLQWLQHIVTYCCTAVSFLYHQELAFQ